MRVDPLGDASVFMLLRGSRLSNYSIMWPCLIVSQHFSCHSSPLDKSKRRAETKGLLILNYKCKRDSEFKVVAASENKSHGKRLRYGETERERPGVGGRRTFTKVDQ